MARGAHARPCDLCGHEIIPGDVVATWCYVGEDGPSSSNIMRTHQSCEAIVAKSGPEQWTRGHAFESPGPPETPWMPTMKKYEAAQNLAAARVKLHERRIRELWAETEKHQLALQALTGRRLTA